MGAGIFVHELAHAIGNYFENNVVSKKSFESYNNLRICLNDMQHTKASNKEEVRQYLEDYGAVSTVVHRMCQYTEEDWADFISATVTGNSNPNYGCFLVKQNSNAYTSSEVYKTEDSGCHSPKFFRLLHMQMVKNGSLPNSCHVAASDENIPLTFKKCDFGQNVK